MSSRSYAAGKWVTESSSHVETGRAVSQLTLHPFSRSIEHASILWGRFQLSYVVHGIDAGLHDERRCPSYSSMSVRVGTQST